MPGVARIIKKGNFLIKALIFEKKIFRFFSLCYITSAVKAWVTSKKFSHLFQPFGQLLLTYKNGVVGKVLYYIDENKLHKL